MIQATRTPYSVYSDESATDPKEQFLGYGAVFLPSEQVDIVENIIDGWCSSRGLQGEVSWKRCRLPLLSRYREFADLFWQEMVPRGGEFRCMIVNTEQNPLVRPEFKCITREDGFYRFYHFFLTRGVQLSAPTATSVNLIVGDLTDQYPFRPEVLHKTIEGALRQRRIACTSVTMNRSAPRDSRIHQMADLLLGAVTFSLNQRDSEVKRKLHDHVQGRVGQPLNRDFGPDVAPFNVWPFVSRGSRRWAEGSFSQLG